ncbi:glutaminase A [bacterium]|nr:glutaminase A [bacterium]
MATATGAARSKKSNPNPVPSTPEGLTIEGDLLKLFNALDLESVGKIPLSRLLRVLDSMGIKENDPRIKIDSRRSVEDEDSNATLDFEEFKNIIHESNGTLIKDAIEGNLIIPDFKEFVREIKEVFDRTRANRGGHVATYIPQLGRVDPEQFAVSVCTIDGQRAALGDSDRYFCIQSISKPINYAIAMEENGVDRVHQHVGREPSGISFNGLVLNEKGIPHNPMINSGAIMTCSLIHPEKDMSERFDYVLDLWTRLSGGIPARFNNSVYLSERQTADRNFALGYFMRENGAFPADTDLIATLEFYFQCCSIEVSTEAMAIVASTLANAGVCPITGIRIFKPETVKNCLSLMYSCGMYDFSGEFAFSIGLPAKSGVAGGLMIVVPNLLGMAVWSPRLDNHGNTVRGIEFCKELVQRFNFHNYDSLIEGVSNKIDPRLRKNESRMNSLIDLCWAASAGDVYEVQKLIARGVNVNDSDYDRRTPLHIAASEGHAAVVDYLLSHGASIDSADRWGNTPYDDALRNGHEAVVERMKAYRAEVQR